MWEGKRGVIEYFSKNALLFSKSNESKDTDRLTRKRNKIRRVNIGAVEMVCVNISSRHALYRYEVFLFRHHFRMIALEAIRILFETPRVFLSMVICNCRRFLYALLSQHNRCGTFGVTNIVYRRYRWFFFFLVTDWDYRQLSCLWKLSVVKCLRSLV